jgi:hypothetical protein
MKYDISIQQYSKNFNDLGAGIPEWTTGAPFSAGGGDFSCLHRVQTGSGARTASYLMGSGEYFLDGKAAVARSSPLTSI